MTSRHLRHYLRKQHARTRSWRPPCRRRALPTLAEIQSSVRDAVIAENSEAISSLLVGGQAGRKRLEIHRRHYEISLVIALVGKFPATGWLVGTPFVTEAARHYVHDQPPEAPCIAEYGEGFPQFLAECPGGERLP